MKNIISVHNSDNRNKQLNCLHAITNSQAICVDFIDVCIPTTRIFTHSCVHYTIWNGTEGDTTEVYCTNDPQTESFLFQGRWHTVTPFKCDNINSRSILDFFEVEGVRCLSLMK